MKSSRPTLHAVVLTAVLAWAGRKGAAHRHPRTMLQSRRTF